MTTTQRRTHKRLRLFVVSACCLLAVQLPARKSVGQIHVKKEIPFAAITAKLLLKEGPRFADQYFPYDFYVRGFVRAAPMVIEYRLGNKSVAQLIISTKLKPDDKDETIVFVYNLKPTGGAIKPDVFRLPEKLGNKPLV